MVRKHTHKTGRLIWLVAILALFARFGVLLNYSASAENSNVTFEVDVVESLTVAVTTPTSDAWATGYANDFLRNTVNLQVSSNNASGFTASMTTSTASTNLENTAATSTSVIPSISTPTARGDFNTSGWGYSLEGASNADTIAGTDSGIYNTMVGLGAATPITVMSSENSGSSSQNIFFGAKADYTADSGTYVGTVVISVVSGVTNSSTNPVIPEDPATPIDSGETNPDYSGAGTTTGGGTNGTTTYTTVSQISSTAQTPGTRTVTTHVDDGDTRSSYTAPAGVTKVNEGTPLATGLAITSAVAAATGIVFFIIAKRREDDEDEEDY